MAAKKTNTGAILLVVGLAAAAWFFLSRKKSAAGGGGGAYGGGGGTPLFPGGTSPSPAGGAGAPSALNIPIPSFGPSLAQRIKSLLGFVAAGNQQGMLLQSSNQYLPGLGTAADLSIPLQPMQLFDVSQLAQPIPFDTGSVAPTDLSLSDYSIPYDSFNTGGVDPNSFLQTQDIQYQPLDGGIQTTPVDLNFSLDSNAAYQGQYDPTNPSAGGY